LLTDNSHSSTVTDLLDLYSVNLPHVRHNGFTALTWLPLRPRSTRTKTCPYVTFSTTNLTWTGLESNF